MIAESDVELADGRKLHVYDTGGGADRLPVFWHHGTPNIGPPPEPLFAAADGLRLRWLGYDRPGYGGSSPHSGRNVASAAADVSSIADALGIARFGVMGHSGGPPHALACAALLPQRVVAVVSVSGLAPLDALADWFGGMGPAGEAELRAALGGRPALERYLRSSEFDPELFTPADHEALAREWSWLNGIAAKGLATGFGGMVDDNLAYVAPWGFDPAKVTAPVLIVQGGSDRIVPSSHGKWLASHIASAELWLRPGDGHISALNSGESALRWLRDHATVK
ncbi:MAG TPA: alpha/beta fold hydrolase [Candidatus Dormibacteraeota bacterium]|nr:alpha/beta fold hydrolase [Candidatus Dormibacteraeota bacterium]